MSKHVREKSGKLCISSILRSKRGTTPTKIDANWRHSNLIWRTVKKVICKISAQYVTAYRRKVHKAVYFQYSKSKMGHNSYKYWRKLTTLKPDLTVQLKKVICKISAQYVEACTGKRKVRKTVYFQYSKVQKGHNSYKNWRKLTTLELDL